MVIEYAMYISFYGILTFLKMGGFVIVKPCNTHCISTHACMHKYPNIVIKLWILSCMNILFR